MKRVERDYAQRTLFDKLGVAPQKRVALINGNDAALVAELKERLAALPATTLRGRYDIIFMTINRETDLAKVSRAVRHLRADGALWVFHPKGKGASPTDGEVRAAGLAAGLVDNKICAYNDTHTATRYVVPVARRPSWE